MLAGLAALINPDSWTAVDSIFEQSAETWGWWHLIIGAIVFFAGFGVFSGNVLARTVGVIVATISAISAFVWMPVYPIWGICLIAIDVMVDLGTHRPWPRRGEGGTDAEVTPCDPYQEMRRRDHLRVVPVLCRGRSSRVPAPVDGPGRKGGGPPIVAPTSEPTTTSPG